MSEHNPDLLEGVDVESDVETTEPPLYRVLLLNDDYTTMEFVVQVLIYVFNKNEEDAMRIMLNVHRQGVGICGVYPHEVAETKVSAVEALAQENGFPLKSTMEKE